MNTHVTENSPVATSQALPQVNFDMTLSGDYLIDLGQLGSVKLHLITNLGRFLCIAFGKLTEDKDFYCLGICCRPDRAFIVTEINQITRTIRAVLLPDAPTMRLKVPDERWWEKAVKMRKAVNMTALVNDEGRWGRRPLFSSW